MNLVVELLEPLKVFFEQVAVLVGGLRRSDIHAIVDCVGRFQSQICFEAVKELHCFVVAALRRWSPALHRQIVLAQAVLAGESLALLLIRQVERLAVLKDLSIQLDRLVDQGGDALRHGELVRPDQDVMQVAG